MKAHKHNYKQTGTVMIGTGKYWAYLLSSGATEPLEMPLTNIDEPIKEIKEECLVFICDGCGDIIVKPLKNIKTDAPKEIAEWTKVLHEATSYEGKLYATKSSSFRSVTVFREFLMLSGF